MILAERVCRDCNGMVIRFTATYAISDLGQVGGFLVGESGIKYHNPSNNPSSLDKFCTFFVLIPLRHLVYQNRSI